MHKGIPVKRNTFLAMFLIMINVWIFLLAPAAILALEASPALLWSIIPCILTTNTQWYLMHEAFHHGLHPNHRTNEVFGRSLSIAFFAPFTLVRFGHMMHHRFNGSLFDRPDLYGPNDNRLAAWVGYYFQLLGGMYLQELLSCAVFILGRKALGAVIDRYLDSNNAVSAEVAKLCRAHFLRDSVIRAMRRDGLISYTIIALSLAFYASAGLWWIPIAMILVRAFLISFANNLPHYGTESSDVYYGMNMQVPAWISPLILNSNYHRIHHHHPTLPWPLLPEQMKRSQEIFDRPLLALAFSQLKGPRRVSVNT